MRTRSTRVFRDTFATSVLLVALADLPAVQRQAENEWRIENATVSAVPFISEFISGQWVRRMPGKSGSLLEVRGNLKVEGDGSFGPLRLTDVGLLSGASGVPAAAELVAVGTGSVSCKYLPAQVAAGEPMEVKLGAGKEFALLRDGGTGPVLLRTRAPTLDLCMAFELSGNPPPALLWSVAGRSVALAVGTLAPPSTMTATPSGNVAVPLGSSSSASAVRAWWEGLSTTMVWGALAATTALLVTGVAVLRLRRQRQREGDNTTSDDGPAAKCSSGAASALRIPRVTPVHHRTTFVRIEADGGAGQQMFRDALSSLRLGEWARANDLFGEAIAAGLTPTFEAGAWSLCGEARLNCNDLVGAMTCFLQSLSCRAVTTESVLFSANHLSVIYRELRLNGDARKMEKLRTLVSPFADEISPERRQLIARLVKEFKRKRRATIFVDILPWR